MLLCFECMLSGSHKAMMVMIRLVSVLQSMLHGLVELNASRLSKWTWEMVVHIVTYSLGTWLFLTTNTQPSSAKLYSHEAKQYLGHIQP